MRTLMVRGAVLGGWVLVTSLLSLWLVEALQRGHLSAVLIVCVALCAVIVVPLLAARLRS